MGSWAFRPAGGAQAPIAEAAPKPKRLPLEERFPFVNEKHRHKDFMHAVIGNMRPLIHDAHGVRFQSREAIAYKDGTAKLWSFEQEDPIAEEKTIRRVAAGRSGDGAVEPGTLLSARRRCTTGLGFCAACSRACSQSCSCRIRYGSTSFRLAR